ncbi:DUF2138 domain-containing protein [Pseudomonas argentinensis]|uniref:Uncharacterized conserved protein YfaA, DUF2138 family n=1 Tax=Phytopseudomonas argentinensis TaxID=289370 RepID=A0A1I3HVD2_9GAMM|nr:DUF2138 domain-containing protein [Pseudomonas argentinensis]KAB0548119.1 DUF2138 domain-containing protein [Pseudomonas argentinensis]SFI39718.1 Uncharacterized conserved protein YfaA, DUF2138 family [Pseudomonas argentinensis]
MNRNTTAHLRHVALLLAAGLLAACGQDSRDLGERSALGLDLQRPDALIESASLSRLPKDLLAVPLLRDTLTEDFVFYYEHNADRLGLVGSLRRIIYERDLKLRDELLDELLDQPADVALWKGADGKLKHFVMVMQRGGLAKVLEPLAHVALDDTQLSKAGELHVDGGSVPLYRLNYLGDRALLLASHGDKLLVLSSPGMLFGEDDKLGRAATESVEALLDGDNPFAKRFGLKARETEQQRISLSGEYVALGYQRFFPAFAGVRFEKGEGGWSSFLALNEFDDQPAMDFTPIWKAMPMGASACVAVPVAPGSAEKLLERVGASKAVSEDLQKRLGSTAGLCWYADSRLHSPLLVTHLDEAATPELDQAIGGLFDGMIGAFEPNAENGRFPVESQSTADGHTWRREVGSNFGQYPAEQGTIPDALVSQGFFRVSLARQGQTLLFSLDDRLVDKALDTLNKRFPPLAEVLPTDGVVPGYLAPEGLSRLLEQETLDSLPANYEPVFRNAADTHLLPKLRAMGGYGQFALTLPKGTEADDDWKWIPLEWRAL